MAIVATYILIIFILYRVFSH
ncbi:hypothetical protein FDH96_gp092 [Mycobacterium phage Rey]|uniref:Uncharacterized protein n=1 Tax=Mycobacterium phage Rey TaxID=1034115 RepID=G1D5F4_9CAUD|nr:hypothetical protein FDH96_gp092 [Mycobacterium phage Rey]AEK10003.1 hypothetical protein PBI_REY_92 [Mycobacterium phage Rey]